jgi:hypothetical protein
MKVEISVSGVAQVFKEMQEQPGKILEMVRADMPKEVGGCMFRSKTAGVPEQSPHDAC